MGGCYQKNDGMFILLSDYEQQCEGDYLGTVYCRSRLKKASHDSIIPFYIE